MAEPIVVTHSDLEAFLRCRRLFSLGYIEDFQAPETEWGALMLGKRVHKGLEHMYRTGEDPVVEHDRLAREAVARLELKPGPPYAMKQLYDDIVMGRNCVAAYRDWLEETGADDGLEVLAVEETIEAPILDGRVLLRGKVDTKFARLSDGGIIINDFKTSGVWRTGHRERLERAYQHHVYLAIERLLHRESRWVAGAMYSVMKKVMRRERATSPLVERFPVPATMRTADTKLAQIERICSEMLRLMEDVGRYGSLVVAFPTPQEACRWCPMKHPCELMDENPLAARALLDAEFGRGHRHDRYGDVVD